MINANARPYTGNVNESAIVCVLVMSPMTVSDHLLHAWDALAAASRGEKRDANVAYAPEVSTIGPSWRAWSRSSTGSRTPTQTRSPSWCGRRWQAPRRGRQQTR